MKRGREEGKKRERNVCWLLVILCMQSLRDATGKFPDFPDADDGGSEAIFKKREEVSETTITTIITTNNN